MINPYHPRLTVPDDVASGIDIHKVKMGNAPVEQLFSESFFAWLKKVVYDEDWGSTSWEIASEILLWNPISALQQAWDDGDMLENLEVSSLNDVSLDQLSVYLKDIQDWESGADPPGLHIFPLQIGDTLIYLIGSIEFWQGGFVPDWIGVTINAEDLDDIWHSTGSRSLSKELTTEDVKNIWFEFNQTLNVRS